MPDKYKDKYCHRDSGVKYGGNIFYVHWIFTWIYFYSPIHWSNVSFDIITELLKKISI